MPALQLGTFTSENQREVGVPKKVLVPICCTEDDKMDICENSFHLSSHQGNKFGSCNNQSKSNFGGTWPRSKVKGNFSLTSSWAESSSNREREVKSEERCVAKVTKAPVNGLGAVIEMQKDRDKMARHSPTSKDEFWEALWSHYDCLMDDGLIESCREANGELSLDDQEVSLDYTWSFTEFIEQFNQLHDWLHKLQSAVVGNEEQEDKGDSIVVEELQKVVYRCKLFNEQAQQLDKRYPDMKDEINRRVNLLNNKWEAAEQAVNPHKPQQTEDGILQEVAYQMKCLRKWLRELESSLGPLKVCPTWTVQDLESKLKEQLVLQKEIESRGKYVSTLLKSCDRLVGCRVESTGPQLSWDAQHIHRVAKNLERRWHALWLKSLERQCLIEELLKKYRAGFLVGDPAFDLSFSEEPLTKYPRLSTEWDDVHISKHDEKNKIMESEQVDQVDAEHQEQMCESTLPMTQDTDKDLEEDANTNSKGIMVGSSGIAELKAGIGSNVGRFEIIQDVGYSSESSAHLSNDERQEFIRVYSYSPVLSGPSLVSEYAIPSRIKDSEANNSNSSALSSVPLPYLPPDKYPSIPFKHWQFAIGEDPLHMSSAKRPLSTPNSTFYKMTSIDTENGEDGPLSIMEEKYPDNSSANINNTSAIENSQNLSDQDNSYQLMSSSITAKTRDSELSDNDLTTSVAQVQPSAETESIHQLIAQAKAPSKESVQMHARKKSTRNAHVQEWLRKHQMNKSGDYSNLSRMTSNCVDSSCDASGEYTTNESDSEDSSSSADVNGSLAMSRSYTGSVETVIPTMVSEDSKVQNDNHTESAVFPSTVNMRGKRKNIRGRPWSVTEVSDASNELRLSAHSTSEGALDMLCSSTVSQSNVDPSSSKWFARTEKDTLCPSEGTSKLSTSSSNSSSRPRRNHSRSSLHNSRYSGSGSDSLSPSSTTFCKSTYSDVPYYSTPTHRRKSGLLPPEKCSAQVSPVYRHRSSHSRLSSSGSSRKKSSQSSPESYQSVATHLANNCCKEVNEDAHVVSQLPSSSVADSDQALTQTEDQSSVSDQVWDGYQDPPYFSEPYSEQGLNEEEVRKLIDFGDDYGAYIGFHSDASSFSGGCRLPTRSHLPRSQSFVSTSATEVNADSDSDVEDLQHILSQSMRNLQAAKNTFKQNLSQNEATMSEYANLLATCQTHLQCLHVIAAHLPIGDKSIGYNDFNCLTKLINEWESLKREIGSKHKGSTDQQTSAEYLEIQHCLCLLSEKISCLSSSPCQSHETLDLLCERIAKLQASRSTLQQTKDSLLEVSKRIVRLMGEADLVTCPLKEEFNQLYQKWEDTYEENGIYLTDLQEAYQKWQGCNALCEDLQKSIEERGTNQVDEQQLTKVKAMLNEIKGFLGTNEPWQTLSERISSLQPSKGFSIPEPPPTQLLLPTIKKSRTRLWKIIRVALPIQLALMLLYCIGYLLEPKCCDYTNTLTFSLSPQLRYVGGPPPV